MRLLSRFNLFLFFFLLILSCAQAPKKTSSNAAVLTGVSDKGNSLYYYLISELQNLEGQNENALFYLDKAIKKNPDSPYLIMEKAYELARRNKIDEAYELAKKAHEKNPGDVDLNIFLGKIHSTRKETGLAVESYQQALQKAPQNEEAYNLLAREYMAQGKVKEAIQILKELINVNPSSVSAYFYLGSIYATSLKDYDRALKAYEEVLNIDPDNPKIMEIISEIYLVRKDLKKAQTYLKQLIDQDPSDLNNRIRVALLYYELKEVDRAIDEFEAILNIHPGADKILYYLGLLYEERKETEKAHSYYGQIPFTSEFFNESIIRRVLLLKNDNKLDAAVDLVYALLKKKSTTVEFYDLLSSIYLSQNNYGKALEILKLGLQKKPKEERLMVSLAIVYEKMGDSQKSLEKMQEILKINPQNTTALNYVGYTYAERGENLEEALTLIQRALALKPDDGFIIDSLGWVFYQKGHYEKARELLKQADKLSPEEPSILEHLGDVYLKLKDKRGARKCFEKSAAQLRTMDERSLKEDEQLKRILEKLASL